MAPQKKPEKSEKQEKHPGRKPREMPPGADAYGRVVHPLIGKQGKYPFTETPDDFSKTKHRPLSRKDFAEEWQFYGHKAELARRDVEKFEAKMKRSKELGSGEERKGKAAFLKTQARLDELRARLEKQGVDVDALTKSGEPSDE